MTDAPPLKQETTKTLDLAPGDVVIHLAAGESGALSIHHNIASIEETGEIGHSKGDVAGILLALSMFEVMSNDLNALQAAMKRVMAEIQGKTFKIVK